MITIYFTLRDIRELCGDTFYKRGKSYYDFHRVSKLTFDANNNCYTAQVKGSKAYRVQIDIDDSGDIETQCSCPAYESYGCCKHVAATLIAINRLEAKESANEDLKNSTRQDTNLPELTQRPSAKADVAPSSRAYKLRYNQADLFISSMADSVIHADRYDAHNLSGAAEQLQFEFILQVHNSYGKKFLSLEMRVGLKRLYVVSKLNQFLEYLEQRKPLYFTSKFTFNSGIQQISKADREFLDVLILLKNTEKIYSNGAYAHYGYSGSNGRAIPVPPLAWDKLKTLLPEVNVILEGAGHPGIRAEIASEAPQLHFSIDQDRQGEYYLSASGLDQLQLLPDYSSMIMNGRIYNLDSASLRMISLVQQQFMSTRRLQIAPQQIESVVQQVLPALRKIGRVSVKKALREQMVESELQAKLYLDYTDGSLTARLNFHYEEIIINPLEDKTVDAEHKHIILIRNVQKENKIIAVLDNSSMSREGQYWASATDSGIYEALYEVIPAMEGCAEVFVSQTAQRLVLERKSYPKVKADLNETLDFLEISFELEGIDEQDTIRVMQAIVEKKKYIRLRNGSFLPIADEGFNEFGVVASQLNLSRKDLKKSVIRLPSVQALRLPERGKSFKHTKWGKSLRAFLNQLQDPESMEFELPEQMQAVLRDYQVSGFQWMKVLSNFRFGGILADDMGLGKTIQSIAYICSELADTSSKEPVLILCPASLTYNWSNEFARFAPSIKVLVAAGQKEERNELLEGAPMEEADVIITSYPLLRRDIDHYSGKTFHALILDEAQAIKNSASQTAQAVKSIMASRKFALTGTPIENSVDELETIFSTVFPSLFAGRHSFKELPAEHIAKIVSPFILRRLKKDVLEELPDRIDTMQYTELMDEQKKVYLAYLSRLREDTEQDLQAEGFQKSRMKILAGITRLRQICCHPSLFIENYTGGSGKLEQLLEIVKECRDSGKRMLVYSQFSSMLQMIRQSLADSGITSFSLDGSTPARERVELCRRFNDGEEDVFLISLKAGGTGLNLTGADTVILYDLWWNPAVEEQAIGRAHRMGQRNVVQVIRLITEGSIEEKILELQQRKKDLIEEVIEAGETNTTRLSEEDIRELLS